MPLIFTSVNQHRERARSPATSPLFQLKDIGQAAAKFHGLRFDPLNLVMYVNGLTNR